VNTTAALTLLEPEKVRADVFFDRTPVVTPWDIIRQKIQEEDIGKHGTLEIIKHDFEPLKAEDPRDHAHWVQQQILRLALLYEAHRPLVTEQTCECCGSRKADPLFGDNCLECREWKRQMPNWGGRGSCEYLAAQYNPRSHSWGIIYYWSHGRSDPFIFWLADYYPSRREAELALLPIKRYEDWLDQKHNGLCYTFRSFSRLLAIEVVMKMELPFTPERLREYLRDVINQDMQDEQHLMRWVVRNALDEHKREERD